MKMWVKMMYKGWAIDRKLENQFKSFNLYGILHCPLFKPIQDELPLLCDRYVNVWNDKMGSMIHYKKEDEDDINLQEAIYKLATGEITTMDW